MGVSEQTLNNLQGTQASFLCPWHQINANYSSQSEGNRLTGHVRFRPRDSECVVVVRLHISWRARGVQWASQQCLRSFHVFCCGTELPKAISCHTLVFFWLPSLYSQLNLVLVDAVGCLDSLERPHFLCSHFSPSCSPLSEKNCMEWKDLKGIFSPKTLVS